VVYSYAGGEVGVLRDGRILLYCWQSRCPQRLKQSIPLAGLQPPTDEFARRYLHHGQTVRFEGYLAPPAAFLNFQRMIRPRTERNRDVWSASEIASETLSLAERNASNIQYAGQPESLCLDDAGVRDTPPDTYADAIDVRKYSQSYSLALHPILSADELVLKSVLRRVGM